MGRGQGRATIERMEEKYLFIAADCPNGHRPGVKYTHKRLRELLDQNALKFYCKDCDLQFEPSEQAKINLRKQVDA
jgi:hypothetical protein